MNKFYYRDCMLTITNLPIGWQYYIKHNMPYLYKDIELKYLKDICTELNFLNSDTQLFFDYCISQYNQENRYYHNLSHLCDIFTHLKCYLKINPIDSNSNNILKQIVAAILAHDVIYKSSNKLISDEQQSANKLLEFFPNYQLAYELILSTQHTSNNNFKKDFYQELFCCLDLSILGQDKIIYNDYANNIRKEYLEYSDSEYQYGRSLVLKNLLEKQDIFNLEEFSCYKNNYKSNLLNELSSFNNSDNKIKVKI